MSKFAPRSLPGIFLGYHLAPGGRWKGDFYVAPFDNFSYNESEWKRKVQVHRIKEVMFNSTKEVEFPLKVLHDKSRRKIPTGIGMISTSEKGEVDANPPLEAPSLGGVRFIHRETCR